MLVSICESIKIYIISEYKLEQIARLQKPIYL